MVDDVLKGKSLTFEELTKLDYRQFNIPKNKDGSVHKDAFNPSSILDLNDDDSEDEILRKFKIKKKSLGKQSVFIPSHKRISNSLGGNSNDISQISSGINNLNQVGLKG